MDGDATCGDEGWLRFARARAIFAIYRAISDFAGKCGKSSFWMKFRSADPFSRIRDTGREFVIFARFATFCAIRDFRRDFHDKAIARPTGAIGRPTNVHACTQVDTVPIPDLRYATSPKEMGAG